MKSYNKTLREFFKDFEIKCKGSKDYEHSLSAVTEVRLAEVYLHDKLVFAHDYLDAKVKGYSERNLCFGVVNPMDSVYSYNLFEIYLDDETSEEEVYNGWYFPTEDDDDDFIGWD